LQDFNIIIRVRPDNFAMLVIVRVV
jgi:hypothetical protein